MFERESSCKKGAELCQFFEESFSIIDIIHHLMKIIEDFAAINIDNARKTRYFCHTSKHKNLYQLALLIL